MILSIYSKDGIRKAETDKFEYNGQFMSIPSITLSKERPTPIRFDIGDYLTFRGDKFKLSYSPAAIKQARPETVGDAFVYENIRFVSEADDLTTIDFLDVALNDNGIHYSSQPNWDFYGDARALADRLQANLNRIFTGTDK